MLLKRYRVLQGDILEAESESRAINSASYTGHLYAPPLRIPVGTDKEEGGKITIFLQMAALSFVFNTTVRNLWRWILQQNEMMNHSYRAEREVSPLSPVEV